MRRSPPPSPRPLSARWSGSSSSPSLRPWWRGSRSSWSGRVLRRQFLTFASFIGMGRGSPFKTIASMCLGFALASIGLDTVTGQLRMTFGFTDLLTGVKFLTAVIGLFGIGEILTSMETGLAFSGTHAKLRLNAVIETWKKLPQYWVTLLRSCAIGCWMGITPGGATPASFMSYGLAKRFGKHGDRFGTGDSKAVAANGRPRAGDQRLPMITLGIPARRPPRFAGRVDDLGPAAGRCCLSSTRIRGA